MTSKTQYSISKESALEYAYTIISNDIIGLLSLELNKYFSVRKLTQIYNEALKTRSRSFTYQRLQQLMEKAQSKGGEKHA